METTMTLQRPTESQLLERLRQVLDPELGCNIVDLGLVYSAQIVDGRAHVVMTLTTPGCPMHETLRFGAENALLNLEDVEDVTVELVWDPPWNPGMMTEAGRALTGLAPF